MLLSYSKKKKRKEKKKKKNSIEGRRKDLSVGLNPMLNSA